MIVKWKKLILLFQNAQLYFGNQINRDNIWYKKMLTWIYHPSFNAWKRGSMNLLVKVHDPICKEISFSWHVAVCKALVMHAFGISIGFLHCFKRSGKYYCWEKFAYFFSHILTIQKKKVENFGFWNLMTLKFCSPWNMLILCVGTKISINMKVENKVSSWFILGNS